MARLGTFLAAGLRALGGAAQALAPTQPQPQPPSPPRGSGAAGLWAAPPASSGAGEVFGAAPRSGDPAAGRAVSPPRSPVAASLHLPPSPAAAPAVPRRMSDRVAANALLQGAAAAARADGPQPQNPAQFVLRTAAAARSCKSLKQHEFPRDGGLPPGCPAGPWVSFEEAEAALDGWASDVNTGDGGFSLKRYSSHIPNSKRGQQKVLSCWRHRSAKGSCKYALTLEETSDGWIILYGNLQHNHADFIQTRAEALAYGAMRSFPDWAEKLTMTLAKASTMPQQIFRILKETAAETGEEVTFTQADVTYRTRGTAADKVWDANGFVEQLQRRKMDDGLHFDVTLKDGCLHTGFWEMKGALAAYANMVESGASVGFDNTVCAPPLLTPRRPTLRAFSIPQTA